MNLHDPLQKAEPGERTMGDLVREYFPNATDDEINFILWEQTPFPLVSGDLLRPNLEKLRDRAIATGKRVGMVQP